MSSRNFHYIVHPALKGLNVTMAATILQPDELVTAENIEYFTSGSRKKRRGTQRYNTSTIGASTTITALEDFWRYGSSLTPTQKFVCHAGTQIYKDDGDGVWDSIKTSWGSNSSPTVIMVGQGYAVFFNGSDTPQKWDQTTVSDLRASSAAFSGGIYHQRRGWLFPNYPSGTLNPSSILYTAAGDITDHTGGDTGQLIIDEDDGDRLIGVSQTWRGRIFLFKGPQFGSVHEISGTSPSTYARSRLFTGAPCVSHHSIITTPNDIFWASRYGFHSLQATDKFGDTEEAFISRPIQKLFNDLNGDQLVNARGFYHPTRNIVGWAVAEGGYTQNTIMFIYNFLLGLWAVWRFTGFNIASCDVMLDPSGALRGSPRLYVGGYDGFVREGDQVRLSDDYNTVSSTGSSYTAKIKTPIYTKLSDAKDEITEAQFDSIVTIFAPKSSSTSATMTVLVDGRSQSYTVSFAGGGAVLDSFILDTDVLGGDSTYDYEETPILDRGRSIQIEYQQAGTNEDMEIMGYAIRYMPGEMNAKESS